LISSRDGGINLFSLPPGPGTAMDLNRVAGITISKIN